MKNISLKIISYIIMPLFVMGCEISTSVWLDDDYDIRIINRSENRIKIIWDDTSYYYLDKDESIVISSISFGTHNFEYVFEYVYESSGRRIKSSKVYKIKVNADFVIIFRDDYEDGFIISDWYDLN